MNIKDTFSAEDIAKLKKAFVFYFLFPLLTVFFTTFKIQDPKSIFDTLIAMYALAAGQAVTLIRVYSAGLDPKDLPVGTTTTIESLPNTINVENKTTEVNATKPPVNP